MIAIRDGRSAVKQQDMMDAVTRPDKKRSKAPHFGPQRHCIREGSQPTLKDPMRNPVAWFLRWLNACRTFQKAETTT